MRKILISVLLTITCSSCTRWIIPEAIKNNQPVLIEVHPAGDAGTDPDKFYKAKVTQQANEYEFVVTRTNGTSVYYLPPNKLNLLSQMEANLKDLKAIDLTYVELIITGGKAKKKYRINTDIISDFIGGLKKKN